MKTFFKIVFWAIWSALGLLLHWAFITNTENDDATIGGFIAFLVLWWGITTIIVAAMIKWKQYRKQNPAPSKETKEFLRRLKEKEKYRNSAEFKQKYISEVAIDNLYFGNGVLVRDSSSGKALYTDIKSGFDKLFHSFGNKFESSGKENDHSCDLSEFIVEEKNIDYVLASLEKIYKRSYQIMEECYTDIYKEITEFFEDNCGEPLKKEFSLAYLKENWYGCSVGVYDDHLEVSIGIDAAENREHDSYYDIIICVDYDTQKPDVSFNIVW